MMIRPYKEKNMKKFSFLFTLLALNYAFAVPKLEFTLRDGEVLSGYLICQTKGNLTLKSGSGRVTVLKKSIRYFGDKDITRERHFMLPDSLILVNKNEIAFVITAPDPARIRLRKILPDGSEKLWGEKSGVPGDTLVFFVPDGRFYEAVEYTRSETEIYYGIGSVFQKNNRCNTFSKDKIDLRGFTAGERVPQLRGDMLNFKRDGD
jgi:hypothetical protein